MTTTGSGCVWFQRVITLKAVPRGCHNITDELSTQMADCLTKISVGVMHVTIQHTTASICLNERVDPDVLLDAEMAFSKIAPKEWQYKHRLEEADDAPAHVKTALIGASLSVPVNNGKLVRGQWQGVWLCEHRDKGSERELCVTVQGAPNMDALLPDRV